MRKPKKRRKDRCTTCGRKRPENAKRCDRCALKHRQRIREERGGNEWVEGGVGRPPKIRESGRARVGQMINFKALREVRSCSRCRSSAPTVMSEKALYGSNRCNTCLRLVVVAVLYKAVEVVRSFAGDTLPQLDAEEIAVAIRRLAEADPTF